MLGKSATKRLFLAAWVFAVVISLPGQLYATYGDCPGNYLCPDCLIGNWTQGTPTFVTTRTWYTYQDIGAPAHGIAGTTNPTTTVTATQGWSSTATASASFGLSKAVVLQGTLGVSETYAVQWTQSFPFHWVQGTEYYCGARWIFKNESGTWTETDTTPSSCFYECDHATTVYNGTWTASMVTEVQPWCTPPQS
jgi:hypothetical protein